MLGKIEADPCVSFVARACCLWAWQGTARHGVPSHPRQFLEAECKGCVAEVCGASHLQGHGTHGFSSGQETQYLMLINIINSLFRELISWEWLQECIIRSTPLHNVTHFSVTGHGVGMRLTEKEKRGFKDTTPNYVAGGC